MYSKGILMKKRILALLLSTFMAVSLVTACKGSDKTDGTTASTTADSGSSPSDTEPMRDLTGAELVKEIKIGWNLGNTLDSTGATLSAETAWGNPLTTKEVFDKVKEAGFNAVRIPTTWQGHTSKGPDYTIDSEWMDRVQEIVDYAIEDGLYVILNTHHEDWQFPSYDNADAAKAQLAKTWEQIAERFSGYDEHLIFEGMNEPRKKGTDVEWSGGDQEGWDVVNQLNTVFIDTVRASGGNNAKRILMIPSYAASSSLNAMQALIVPKDDKIVVSVHAYTPYAFALKDDGSSGWRAGVSYKGIQSTLDNITDTFTSKGIPVIIGEMGARNRDNNTEARAIFANDYIALATQAGIPCFWWDNGGFSGSGECFGLLNRFATEWKFPEIIDGLMNGLKGELSVEE